MWLTLNFIVLLCDGDGITFGLVASLAWAVAPNVLVLGGLGIALYEICAIGC